MRERESEREQKSATRVNEGSEYSRTTSREQRAKMKQRLKKQENTKRMVVRLFNKNKMKGT